MAIQPYNVDSAIACENSTRRRDGAYVCNLHHMMGAGIKRTTFKMGQINPLTEGLANIVNELRDRLPHEYGFLAERNVYIDSFIGLSIIRVCTRDGHGARLRPGLPDAPRTERVGSFAFAADPIDIVAIKLHQVTEQRSLSSSGIGSAKRSELAGATDINPLIHLPLAPDEKYMAQRVSAAVAAFPAAGKARDPFVALHQLTMPNEVGEQAIAEAPIYTEQIIPRSALPS
ncbi:hypothetical protein H7097_02595 [Aeromicrobium sp.]|nr:hypothetical protein [Candidatus Saccharibacteria bacterium]